MIANMVKRISLLVTICFLPTLAHAALGYRFAPIDAVQGDSATRVGYEGIMYVGQAGEWVMSPNCPTEWAYFDARENPHFVAMVLTARITEKPLRIYVDDSLPKVSGFCQVNNITL